MIERIVRIEDKVAVDAEGNVCIMSKIVGEVVRCKDCKHCFVNRSSNVAYNECELLHNKVQGDDWFCADGEMRKDG